MSPGNDDRPRQPTAQAPAVEPEYLLPGEVATMLRLSEKSIYRLVKLEPSMPAIKLGGTVRFPRERLLKWLHTREQGRGQPMRQKMRPARKSAPAQESEPS